MKTFAEKKMYQRNKIVFSVDKHELYLDMF